MEFISEKEYETLDELKRDFAIFNYKPAVIGLISDKDGKILLQKRGLASRDENFKYEDISGSLEPYDKNFKSALMREIKEEAGDECKVFITSYVGCFTDTKYDNREKKYINWIFLIYKLDYLGGKIKVCEPTKCSGYDFFDMSSLPKEMSESSKFYWNYYINNI